MSFARVTQRLCGHARKLYSTAQLNTLQSRRRLLATGVCTMCGVALTGKYFFDSTFANKTGKIIFAKEVNESAPESEDKDENEEETGKVPADVYQHARERRFHEFASVEVDGELYMTPQDFLESVTDEEPRLSESLWMNFKSSYIIEHSRIGVRKLSKSDLTHLLKKTPGRSKQSSRLFRDIHDNGIISYSEYLFLLCILTKPKAGFKIAFKMFDTDGNERVDKKEFLVLEEIFRKKSEKSATTRKIVTRKKEEIQDTSILLHFFGEKGNQSLSYEDFYQFMDNLQTEVLELEFLTYSHGMPTISEEDFARVMLRYTDVFDEEEYFCNLRKRIPEEKGLTFEEFRSFFQFLNNLEDFAISIKLYAIAGKPIGKDEFHRAVKVSTGQDLSPHLVHTLYQLFDKDNDGKLSYVEFIGVMKDRLHRGFRFGKKTSSHLMKHVGWNGFKKCMKHNIKAAN